MGFSRSQRHHLARWERMVWDDEAKTEREGTMEIFNSAEDLRVVIRTPTAELIDTRATQLEAEDTLGCFTLRANGSPVLAALVPGELRLLRRDGSEIRVTVSWGSLIAVGHQVRIVVNDARVRHIAPLRLAM